MFFSKDEKAEQERIEKRLAIYESRRKLEVDEGISEWRRSQKNRAGEEILANIESLRADVQKKFAGLHAEDKKHAELVAQRTAEITSLDDKKAAKIAQIEQVEADFKARGLLRDRAIEAEKSKEKAVMEEKDKRIAYLEGLVITLQAQTAGLLTSAVAGLSNAADKEAVTKVVGFGPSSEPKKV